MLQVQSFSIGSGGGWFRSACMRTKVRECAGVSIGFSARLGVGR